MFSNIFHILFYNPIYNGLIFLISTFSWMDFGMAVIAITIIVKLILFPLTRSSIRTQIEIKKIEPLLNEIKTKYEKNKEEQARRMMDLYKEHQINPFASFLLILVQLPILFALYFVFLKSGLPNVHTDILYSFVKAPDFINPNFLGLIDISQKSLILSFLAGITQFLQMKLIMPKIENNGQKNNLKDDLVRNMQIQMKYVLPVFIFFIAYGLASAIALYWTASNLFMIGQELYIRKNYKK